MVGDTGRSSPGPAKEKAVAQITSDIEFQLPLSKKNEPPSKKSGGSLHFRKFGGRGAKWLSRWARPRGGLHKEGLSAASENGPLVSGPRPSRSVAEG